MPRPPQVAREGVVARDRRLVARVALEQRLVDALGRDSRQRRLLLDLVPVAVEPARPPVPAVVRRGPAPAPVLRDGVPVHAVPPSDLREVRLDAALPVRVQLSHEVPLQGPHPSPSSVRG
jgi:hypothetical protein